MSTCRWCGEPFEQTDRRQQYDKPECKKASQNAHRRAKRDANIDREREKQRQRYAANRDVIRYQQTQYRLANLEKVRELNRQYRQENLAKIQERQREYYAAQAEIINERRRARRAADPEPFRERAKQYRAANPDKIKEAWERWYAADPDRVEQQRLAKLARYHADPQPNLERARQWRIDNPDKTRARGRQHARLRRAQKLQAPYEVFTDLEIHERDKWRCGICGKRVNRQLRFPNDLSASIDHVLPLSKGGSHTRANVQSAHLGCNKAKNARTLPQGEQLRMIG